MTPAPHETAAAGPDPAAPLRDALARDAFALYVQPIVELATGKPALAEVLIRLREEESAMLPPGEFLPLFEESGLMPQLDRWVLRHAARRLAGGLKTARLSINVSGQTLYDAAFPKAVAAELAAHRLAPGALLFEIEEALVISRPDAVCRFAEAVKMAGCGVVVDGFGENADGAVIKALRPALVKVHGGIVRALLRSDEAADKLEVIACLCSSLGIGMIAECVEDRNVVTGLKALGVAYAQGFGLEPPQPIESLAR
jgi:EAL domain-containing protein (putative c-di-GMP-specific phosphodiesterase class I)